MHMQNYKSLYFMAVTYEILYNKYTSIKKNVLFRTDLETQWGVERVGLERVALKHTLLYVK